VDSEINIRGEAPCLPSTSVAPGRQIRGQKPPGDAAAEHIEDGVEDLAVGRLGSVWKLLTRFGLAPLLWRAV
jgi:hypothetical protein